MKKRAIIIIPACNEEKNIAGVINGIRNVIPDAEILVVNDVGEDRTEEIVKIITKTRKYERNRYSATDSHRWAQMRFKYKEITDIILKSFYEVYNELGDGFLELESNKY